MFLCNQRRIERILANATHFPFTPCTPMVEVPLVQVFFFDRRGIKAPLFHRWRWWTSICSKSTTVRTRVCVSLCATDACDDVGAHPTAGWLLQGRAEPRPIVPGEGDVGRHLPRHLRRCPKLLAAQVVRELDWSARGFCTFGAIIAEWRSIPCGNRR